MTHKKGHSDRNFKGDKGSNYRSRHKKNKGGNPWDGATETISTPSTNSSVTVKKTNTKMKVKKNG
jgi:hypothetical protein